MKLILNPEKFKHISEESSYNHNYYKHISQGFHDTTKILEIFNENSEFYEFYLIDEDDRKTFLGCGHNSINSDIHKLNEIIIDFKLNYV